MLGHGCAKIGIAQHSIFEDGTSGWSPGAGFGVLYRPKNDLKPFAFNLRHQRQAKGAEHRTVAPRLATICGSGLPRNALGEESSDGLCILDRNGPVTCLGAGVCCVLHYGNFAASSDCCRVEHSIDSLWDRSKERAGPGFSDGSVAAKIDADPSTSETYTPCPQCFGK